MNGNLHPLRNIPQCIQVESIEFGTGHLMVIEVAQEITSVAAEPGTVFHLDPQHVWTGVFHVGGFGAFIGADVAALLQGLAGEEAFAVDTGFLDVEEIGEFGFFHDNYCGDTTQDNSWKDNWAEFFRDNRLGFLLNLIQKDRSLSASEMDTYNKLLHKIPELLPADSQPALIHGDLWSGNYIITENGPALIDPASYYADREMEMGIMTMFGGFSSRFYDAYNHIYPLPSDWRERNQLYQLYHVLNHYYLFGGSYQSQALRIAQYYTGF